MSSDHTDTIAVLFVILVAALLVGLVIFLWKIGARI